MSVGALELDRDDVGGIVSDLAVESSVLERAHFAERRELDVIEAAPLSACVDKPSRVRTLEALGHGVDVAVTA